MHKKSLLLSTATVAIVLFGVHLNAHAQTLNATDGEIKTESGEAYKAEGEGESAVSATGGGKINGTNLTLTGKEGNGTGANASGSGSLIDLKGETTIENITIGLEVKDNAMIIMNGGFINADVVAVEVGDKGIANLNGVTIKSEYDEGGGSYGLSAEGEKAQIAMNGGSIDVIGTAVEAKDKGAIELSNVAVKSKDTGLAAENENATIAMSGGSIVADETAVWAEDKGLIDLNGSVTVTSKNIGLFADKEAKIIMDGGSITADKTAVDVKEKSAVNLNGVTVTSKNIGLFTDKEAKIIMDGGSITADKAAVEVKEKSVVNLNGVAIASKEYGLSAEGENATITMVGGKINGKHAVYAKNGGQIKLANVIVTSSKSDGLFAEGENTKVTMTGGIVTAIAEGDDHQHAGTAFHVREGGQIDVANVFAEADKTGLELYNQKNQNNKVNLINTKLIVKNGIGINLNKISDDERNKQLVENHSSKASEENASEIFDGNITLKNSEIRADILLQITENTKATLTANHSVLEGGTRVADTDNVIFNLNNGSKWILKTSKEETDGDQLLDVEIRSRSDISVLNLNNSSVIFDGPTEGHYQTLQVGTGKNNTEAVYNAKGNAKLYLNAEWSDGKKKDEQKADHLLIKGNVSGSTTVYVNAKGNATEATGFVPWNERGISLIQVSGKAEEDSFKLANGYTTVSGSPYKYTLNAYGPGSSNGSANPEQMLLEKDPALDDSSDEDNRNVSVDDVVVDNKDNDFWDFRLQNQYLANSKVKALVPQMANYLVMPSALFSTGFTDIENQNILLTDIRAALPWDMKNDKRNPFFLSSYGSKTTLSSNRTAFEYGYGADIGYTAIQTGVALAALEVQNISSYFGLLGTYGKLSFTPKNMADADKTALEKWGITAYSSVQHNDGIYVNAFLSYGVLKGNIFNAVIGRTANLDDAKTWSASAVLGKKLATSVEDLVFEPQAQIAYQQLMFHTIKDADNFKVDIGNPHQWAIRMGGRLTKNVNRIKDGHLFSVYGKLNLISTFGNEGTMRAGDNFRLDPMGSAIEGGVGINAQLLQNIALHGDISYQQKLQKAGISGMTLSGGLQYRF
ncbi:autotransporter outer membrane beta-barrel domain-containing protein [Bartonella sp. WD16.2]|uniref:autotransporter outer membrane beta-barrel domain-containing protein n=1 Tax=Bartonella sp. WD16.2 TaxID=1933904 RepID=UPI00099A4378|nr:autotransporter outer membrane beta-barrel domain-containing protein [Bartonella sp. WD16.2]AQX20282.1 outer membrane autotransporter barrel domain-containing protein [Bartonella sp. WD16.2]